MDVSEQESIRARSAELAEWLKHDPDLETHDTDMVLHGLYSEVLNYALLAGDRSMMRGDTAAAMGLLETALHAREQVFKTSHGPFGFRGLQYIDPFLLEDAAIAGRADLIDRAIALEQANSDAHPDDRGHYDARIAVQMKARESIPHLQSIRDAAEREPGIRQVDLLAHCPGTDRKTVSYLVDQLATVGILATENIGNRVHLWPTGHADAPTGDRLRQAVRDFLREPDAEGSSVPPWCFHPEQALEWAQQVLHLMETSLANPERGTTTIPQPTDFRTFTLSAYDAEGHLCSITEDPDEMVMWGHIGGETMQRILDRYLQVSGAQPRRRERWLGAGVRHTHLERVRRTVRRYGREQDVWQLREAKAETEWTVPVTVLNAPGKPPRRGPADDQIIWLAKQDR